jgi:hypothetical protein
MSERNMSSPTIFTSVFLLITVVAAMVILSTNIEGVTTGDHSVYASTSSSSRSTLSPDFNFAAAGDWGCTSHTTDTIKNILDKKPELVLGLGDYSYHQDRVDCWFEIIQPIDGITKIVLGNHDTGEEIEELMNHFDLTEQFYSFDYQNVHFIALATEEEYLDMSNDKAKEQLAFVQSDLEKASSNPDIEWIIPFFHRIMYPDCECSINEYPNCKCSLVGPYDRNLVEIYHPLFEKYGVHLVLQAHAHTYERTYPLKFNSEDSKQPIVTSKDLTNYHNINGLVIASVGTAGATPTSTYIVNELTAVKYKNLFGFLNVDVSADGKTLVGTFYDNADGEIKDRFTITKSSETATPIDDSIVSGGGEDSGDSDGG